MKARIILLIVKVMRFLLRLFHRGGSLPGTIALKLDPNFLTHFHYPKCIVMVTGTNGKTSTSNLIFETFKEARIKVIGNRKGDNLKGGITTLIAANASFNMKVKADAIVIECDELNVPKVSKDIPVSVFCVNNFFRDQLDRAGEMETIIQRIASGIREYKGILVLNGDDPNVVRLKDYAVNAKSIFFGIGKNTKSMQTSSEASEGKFCPLCGNALQYDFYQYSHIGKFHCSNCDFGHIHYHVYADSIDFKTSSFLVNGEYYHINQNALYAMYNGIALLAVCDAVGIEKKFAKVVLEKFKLNDGRNETFIINGKRCILNLVKNPTGANETMKYIQENQADKMVMVILNDNDQDGRDISWIWDANFERLCRDDVKTIICSGKRTYDMALRFYYSGFQGTLLTIDDYEEAISHINKYQEETYIIATYTALQAVRSALRRYS